MSNVILAFDIDDTLYNEIDYVKSGFEEVSKYIEHEYQVNKVFDLLLKLFEESPKNVFNRLFEMLNIPYNDEEIKNLVYIYHKHKPRISLSDDIKDTLIDLKKDYILAIVSDGNYEVQEMKCQVLNLNYYFDKIYLTDEFGKDFWKPNTYIFDKLISEYNIQKENLFYIGDNPNKDFYISKYGFKTVRYYNDKGLYYNSEYKDDIKEDYRIYSLKELPDLIDRIINN